MAHVLDNMIWNAITSGNKNIAVFNGDIGCYRPDIAPFAGMKELTDKNLEKLYEFIPVNRKVALSSLNKMEHKTGNWKLLRFRQPEKLRRHLIEISVRNLNRKSILTDPVASGKKYYG